jgi:hypothetical protein
MISACVADIVGSCTAQMERIGRLVSTDRASFSDRTAAQTTSVMGRRAMCNALASSIVADLRAIEAWTEDTDARVR